MDQSKFRSIVQSAIEREIEAAEMYTKLAEQAEKQNVTVFFQEMADEEKEHRRLLTEFQETRKNVELKLEPVPDLKISQYLRDVEYDDDMSYQDALVMSIKKEEQARDLYRLLGDTNLDPEVQNLFNFLSQQEAKHKLRLEQEYDDAILTED